MKKDWSIFCEVDGCNRQDLKTRNKNNKFGMILCNKHYRQMSRGGLLKNSMFEPNIFEIFEDYAEIVLINLKQEEVGRCIIDLEDLEKCKPHRWRLKNENGFKKVCTELNGKTTDISNVIIKPQKGEVIDHINGNRLNNKKINLRKATHQENIFNSDNRKRNSSGRVGVRVSNRGNVFYWQAYIVVSGNFKHLGYFKRDEFDLAVKAREEAERKYHGEFAVNYEVRDNNEQKTIST